MKILLVEDADLAAGALASATAGVKAWVVKPFQPDQMLGMVAKLVQA